MTSVSFVNVSHTYRSNKSQTSALDYVSISIPTGQFVAFIGPSGCGKSTLLKLAGGILQPTQGSITLDGMPPSEIRKQFKIASLAQSPALLPWRSSLENVELAQKFVPASNGRIPSPELALQMVNLNGIANFYPGELSGGMQQRVALARLLVTNASLWLMDEPFAAIDELNRESLSETLSKLWATLNPTVLWVTHNIAEAVKLADRILVFSPSPGTIIADLPIELPRPRRESNPAFHELVQSVRTYLKGHQDA